MEDFVEDIIRDINSSDYQAAFLNLMQHGDSLDAPIAFDLLHSLVGQGTKRITKAAKGCVLKQNSDEALLPPQQPSQCQACDHIVTTCCGLLQQNPKTVTNCQDVLVLIRLISFSVISRENLHGRVLVTKTLLACLRHSSSSVMSTETEGDENISWIIYAFVVSFIWEVTSKQTDTDSITYRNLGFLVFVHSGPTYWPHLIDRLTAISRKRSLARLKLIEDVFDEVLRYVYTHHIDSEEIARSISFVFQIWILLIRQADTPLQQRERSEELSVLARESDSHSFTIFLMNTVFVIMYGAHVDNFQPRLFIEREIPEEFKSALPGLATLALTAHLSDTAQLTDVQTETIHSVIFLLGQQFRDLRSQPVVRERTRWGLLSLALKYVRKLVRERITSEVLIATFYTAHGLFHPLVELKDEQLSGKKRSEMHRLRFQMGLLAYDVGVILGQQNKVDRASFYLRLSLDYFTTNPQQQFMEVVPRLQRTLHLLYECRKEQRDWSSVVDDVVRCIPLCYEEQQGKTTCRDRSAQRFLARFWLRFKNDVFRFTDGQAHKVQDVTVESLIDKSRFQQLDPVELAAWDI